MDTLLSNKMVSLIALLPPNGRKQKQFSFGLAVYSSSILSLSHSIKELRQLAKIGKIENV